MPTTATRSEKKLQAWAFVWFFCLLAGYFVLRPVREAIGVRGGEGRLSWLYTGTFVAMLFANPVYAWAVNRSRRQNLVPALYLFFATHLVAFCVAFATLGERGRHVAGDVFFIWLSVFNLSAVTTFWGLLVDVFERETAKRRFGAIAAGGTIGAIVGSLLTEQLAAQLGFVGLLALAGALLVAAAASARQVLHAANLSDSEPMRAPGSVLKGWQDVLGTPYLRAIAIYLLLSTITATFVYYEQRELVARAIANEAERTAYYASINRNSNLIVLGLQGLATAALLRWLGVGRALAGVPLVCAAGFAMVWAIPELVVISAFEVLRRTSHFALSKPAQEVLFTGVPRDQKYRAKSFIDTVVYRGGDVIAAWSYTWLAAWLGFAPTALCGVALAVGWIPIALLLGKRNDALPKA